MAGYHTTRKQKWSHQAELSAALGKTIRVYTNDKGEFYEGELIAADAYTLKIFLEDDNSTLTVFKHAIFGYEVVV